MKLPLCIDRERTPRLILDASGRCVCIIDTPFNEKSSEVATALVRYANAHDKLASVAKVMHKQAAEDDWCTICKHHPSSGHAKACNLIVALRLAEEK